MMRGDRMRYSGSAGKFCAHNRLSGFFSCNFGGTIIEYAIVFPLVLLIILGTLEFSIVLYLRGTIEEATRSVARYAITGGSTSITDTREVSLEQMLKSKIEAIVFNPSNVIVTSKIYDTYSSFNSNTGADASGTTAFGGSNQIIRYTVNYTHEFLTPIAYLINGGSGTMQIQSTVFAKNEVY